MREDRRGAYSQRKFENDQQTFDQINADEKHYSQTQETPNQYCHNYLDSFYKPDSIDYKTQSSTQSTFSRLETPTPFQNFNSPSRNKIIGSYDSNFQSFSPQLSPPFTNQEKLSRYQWELIDEIEAKIAEITLPRPPYTPLQLYYEKQAIIVKSFMPNLSEQEQRDYIFNQWKFKLSKREKDAYYDQARMERAEYFVELEKSALLKNSLRQKIHEIKSLPPTTLETQTKNIISDMHQSSPTQKSQSFSQGLSRKESIRQQFQSTDDIHQDHEFSDKTLQHKIQLSLSQKALRPLPNEKLRYSSPYKLFRKEQQAVLRSTQPLMSNKEKVLYIVDKWKTLNENERFGYVQMSKADYERALYVSKLTKIKQNLLRSFPEYLQSGAVSNRESRNNKVTSRLEGDNLITKIDQRIKDELDLEHVIEETDEEEEEDDDCESVEVDTLKSDLGSAKSGKAKSNLTRSKVLRNEALKSLTSFSTSLKKVQTGMNDCEDFEQ
eukprot:403376697